MKGSLRLSDQLKYFAAIEVLAKNSARRLGSFLKRTAKARVEIRRLPAGQETFAFLSPLKSDSTRYLIFHDGKWSYLEMGRRLPFEICYKALPRRIQDRLTPKLISAYLEAFCGRPYPNWRELARRPVHGLEVEYPFYEFTPRTYRTIGGRESRLIGFVCSRLDRY